MHKLLEYICEELEELEQKVSKEHQLSMQDLQLVDTLAHAKKNLMKAEEMSEQGSSMEGGSSYYRGGSYKESPEYLRGGSSYYRGRGRNAARNSRGQYMEDGGSSYYEEGYSRAEGDMQEKIRQKINAAPDERTRRILTDLMSEMR